MDVRSAIQQIAVEHRRRYDYRSYRPLEEFEQVANTATTWQEATTSFVRHKEISHTM